MAINPLQAPIQYGLPPQDPGQALLEGLQIGGAIRGMRQQRQQEEEAAKTKEQFAIDMQSYLAKPTGAGARDLMLKYPGMQQVIAENWNSLSKEMQDQEFKAVLQVDTALRTGNPEAAVDLLKQRRDALQNSGMDASNYDVMIELAAKNPEGLPAIVNLAGASADPKRWGDYIDAIGAEQEGYEMLTPEQVRNLGLDPTKSYQRSTSGANKGRISQIGGGGTTVNVGAGEGAFEKETGKQMAGQFQSLVDQGTQARRNMQDLYQLRESLANVPSGAGKIAALASGLGIEVPGGDEAAAASALIERLIPAQRQPGSGVMTEKDAQMFRNSLPKLMQTPGGREKIINTMFAVAEYDANLGDIASRAQLGEITVAQARQEMAALANPVQSALAMAGGSTVEVQLPDGRRLTFPNQQAADAFKKAAGIQ